jgi:hypothetical protein
LGEGFERERRAQIAQSKPNETTNASQGVFDVSFSSGFADASGPTTPVGSAV